MDSILLALIFILAIKNRGEGFVGYILESFRAADIAGIGINL